MEIAWLLLSLMAGSLAGWILHLIVSNKLKKSLNSRIKELEAGLSNTEYQLDAERRISQNQLDFLQKEREKQIQELAGERSRNEEISVQLSDTEAGNKYLKQKLAEQIAGIEEIQKNFRLEFENTANRLFRKHSDDFSQVSQKNIGDILNPLKDKLQAFEQKVSQAFDTEMREKISLKEEVKQLYHLNQKISDEAENLTRALKGDVKKMGNWGEVILERILEQSGLEKDTNYKTQVSTTDEEGRRLRPDVVIYLPDNKNIIIDSKVSLLAYEKYVNADDENDRNKHAKEHILSIRNHINILSSKEYQSTEGLNSPDFTLLFVPIESSFGIAIKEDSELFEYAWSRKIVIVSPSTLLATLRTIQSIWKQENQSRNAQEIARQGAALYDKFSGFLEDMVKIGGQLQNAQQSYDSAMGKLSNGKGNLISRAINLKALGIKPSKEIPGRLLGNDDNELFNTEAEE